MTDYDFRSLDDKEFELLCVDLLGEGLGVRIERFKPGRDLGVDGRYSRALGGEVVLQCKHRPKTPIDKLLRLLRDEERPKVDRLKPARYLLAVSHQLSRTDKNAIQAALTPHISGPADIYGSEDLNDLLSKRKDIELRHHKLWLTSSTVLSYLLNKAILDRSEFAVQEAQEAAKRYVKTEHHDRALQKLESSHVVILTGEPGAGKTMLAEQLCLHYVVHGFKLVKIAEDIREAEDVFGRDPEQVFYFDDFLGRNYLDALSGHEGNHIVQFMRRVGKDAKKRFILTSRSTILNQGKVLIDTFRNNNVEKNEFVLTVSSLSAYDAGRILYSHVWHSNLSPEYLDELHKQRRYRNVIGHRNFNPRLISFITDAERLIDCPSEHYWKYVIQSLNNPADVWQNPFEAQLDDFGRCIVLLVTLNRRPIAETELAEAYARCLSVPHNRWMHGRQDFQLNIKHLTGSLLSRHIETEHGVRALIDLFNPSVGDYVLRRSANDIPSLRAAFLSLRSLSSFHTLLGFRKNELIDQNVFVSILDDLIQQVEDSKFVSFGPAYVVALLLAMIDASEIDAADRARVAAATAFVLSGPPVHFIEGIARLVEWSLKHSAVSQDDAAHFVIEACSTKPSVSELSALGDVRDAIDTSHPQHDEMSTRLKECAIDYLSNNLYDEIRDADVFRWVDERDEIAARSNVEDLVTDWFGGLGIDCSADEIDGVVEGFDIEQRESEYREEQSYTYIPRSQRTVEFPSDVIDDLFDRS
jgi:hypothetical protein